MSVAQVPSSQPKGTVVAQSPAAGAKVASGQRRAPQRLEGRRRPADDHDDAADDDHDAGVRARAAAPPQGAGNDYRGMQLEPAVQKIAQGRQQAIVAVRRLRASPLGIVVSNGTAGSKMRLSVSAGPKPGRRPTSPT